MSGTEGNEKTKYCFRKSQGIQDHSRLLGEKFLDYRLTQILGSGGMGVVYKAKQESLDRYVAIKLLLEENPDSLHLERLKAEAKIIAMLQHPNIVPVHLLGEDKGRLFIVMDFCEGRTLDSLIVSGKAAARRGEGFFSISNILKVLHQIVLALAYAHSRNIIHRDIKPGNIMVDSQNLCRVMDFGLATYPRLGNPGIPMISGTPAYMSPEQTKGKDIDERSDQFALGVVFYEMLTSVRPFDAQTTPGLFKAINETAPLPPSRLNRKVPGWIDSVVLKMLEKKREDRYKNMQELNEIAFELTKGLPLSAKAIKSHLKVSTTIQGTKSQGFKKTYVLGILVFLLCLGILFWSKGIPSKEQRGPDSYDREMAIARNFILNRRGDLAKPVLEGIARRYSGTSKALEAEKLLKGITGNTHERAD